MHNTINFNFAIFSSCCDYYYDNLDNGIQCHEAILWWYSIDLMDAN